MNEAEDRRDLAEVLLALPQRFLRSLPTRWGPSRAEALMRQREAGWLVPILWTAPNRHAVLAWVERSSNRGLRVHGIRPTCSSPDLLAERLDALDRSKDGPVDAVCGLMEDIRPDRQALVFEPRGFRYRLLVEMELPAGTRLPSVPEGLRLRLLAPEDRDAFVSLYARAYVEPWGPYWLEPSPNVEADGRMFFDRFISPSGEWNSSLIRKGTLAYGEGARMTGSVVMGRDNSGRPYLAGLMVDPAFQWRGIGRALLLRSLHEVRRLTGDPVALSVLRGGPAYGLYGSVGFREVGLPAFRLPGYWIRVSGTGPGFSGAPVTSAGGGELPDF